MCGVTHCSPLPDRSVSGCLHLSMRRDSLLFEFDESRLREENELELGEWGELSVTPRAHNDQLVMGSSLGGAVMFSLSATRGWALCAIVLFCGSTTVSAQDARTGCIQPRLERYVSSESGTTRIRLCLYNNCDQFTRILVDIADVYDDGSIPFGWQVKSIRAEKEYCQTASASRVRTIRWRLRDH